MIMADNRETFLTWIRRSAPGERIAYHRGSIAHFRHLAPLRLSNLQVRADCASTDNPRPPAEAVEIQQLQDALELISAATHMERSGYVHLVQQRHAPGDATYLAVRRKA